MLLYDSENLQIVYRAGPAPVLLCTFSSLGMFSGDKALADGQNFWGRTLAEKNDTAALGFVAKKRNWFCNADMAEACTAAQSVMGNYEKVVSYGSSMGGYGALRWGKIL